MAVPTAHWGLIKNGGREDLTERHNNGEISLQIRQLLLARQIVLDAIRREHRNIEFQRQLFHRRWNQLFSPPATAIGLRDHANNGVASLVESRQGGNGVLRRSPEQDLQNGPGSGFSGDGETINPDMGANTAVGHLRFRFEMNDVVQERTDISGNRRCFDGNALTAFDKPAIKGK